MAEDPKPAPSAEPLVATQDPPIADPVVTDPPAASTDADPAPVTDPPADKKPKRHWAYDRIDELTRKQRDAERKSEALAAALEQALRPSRTADAPAAVDPAPAAPAKPSGPVIPEEVEQKAKEIIAAREFNAACDRAYDQGTKEFPETFQTAVDTLRALGAMEQAFVESIIATDAPAKVLNHLGQNPEEAKRILSLPLRRQVIELDRIASVKPAAKPVSAAPAPVKPLGGGSRTSGELRDEDPIADWIAKRRKQKEARASR